MKTYVKRRRPSGALWREQWAFRELQGHGAAELVSSGTTRTADWLETKHYPYVGSELDWAKADEEGVTQTFDMLWRVTERLATLGYIWRDAQPKNFVYEQPWRNPRAIDFEPLEPTKLSATQIVRSVYAPFSWWLYKRAPHLDVDALVRQHWHPLTPAQIIDSMRDWPPVRRYQPIPFSGFEAHRAHRKEHDAQWKCVKQALPPVRGASVLDAGCNLGYWAFRLREECGTDESLLVDKDRGCVRVVEMLAAHQALPRIRAVWADLTQAHTRTSADILVYLNIHHWIAKGVGDAKAEALLAQRAKKARVLLFEAPEVYRGLPKRLGFRVTRLPSLYKGRPFLLGLR